jgi:uncharacterized repeat protein (TIGR01451 family)
MTEGCVSRYSSSHPAPASAGAYGVAAALEGHMEVIELINFFVEHWRRLHARRMLLQCGLGCALRAALRSVNLCFALTLAAGVKADGPASAADPLHAVESSAPEIVTTMSAEVERKIIENGHESVRLLPADRVVPGDLVIYTVAVRNDGAVPADGLAFTSRIPEHMVYVANSAVGPGAEVTYSTDGGRTFDRPENLFVDGPLGTTRAAMPADYTHIRWVLRNSLKVHSVALARFRAVLK